MRKIPAPPKPYIQAANQGGKQKPTAIILRPTLTPSTSGSAFNVARAWHKNRVSAGFWSAGHYVVDEVGVYHCVKPTEIAGVDDLYKGALLVAICADSVSNNVFWDEGEHRSVLHQTAKLVAALTLAYKIQPCYLDDKELSRWEKRRTRRRGGIHVLEENGWPWEAFLLELIEERRSRASTS